MDLLALLVYPSQSHNYPTINVLRHVGLPEFTYLSCAHAICRNQHVLISCSDSRPRHFSGNSKCANYVWESMVGGLSQNPSYCIFQPLGFTVSEGHCGKRQHCLKKVDHVQCTTYPQWKMCCFYISSVLRKLPLPSNKNIYP